MDKEYWEKYYKSQNAPLEPSPFARDIVGLLTRDKTMLEIGCGNGRDSIYFARNGVKVLAIDQAESIGNILPSGINNLTFIRDDFVTTKWYREKEYDYIYSRFTLHSITENEEQQVIEKISFSLKRNGILFVEARSIRDDIYGLGEKVSDNEYIYQGHYRRFLNINELKQKIANKGFEFTLCNESRGYAQYKHEDPVVIRLIARKI
jgi:cyclopropane fatty-acyl-phospholipid synthase-like methyltransferase